MNYKILIVLIFSAFALGCGDDSSQPVNANNPDQERPDPEEEEPREEEPEPQTPQIYPKFLLVNFEPARTVYSVGIALLPNVTVLDEDLNPIEGAEFEVTTEPPGAARENQAGRWELLREGNVRFLVCASKRNRDGEAVCGTDRVLVDNSPPEITITRPLPGAQLDAVSSPMIEVLGSVAETNGDPIVLVNGEEVPVLGGTFSALVEPQFGVNHIEVAATDRINPKTTVTGVDVLWAPLYQAVEGETPAFELDPAIGLWLGQDFVDDGRPVARLPDGTETTDDLVDILNLILLYLDLSEQIPNPVVDSGGFTLRVPSVDIGKPRVVANIVPGGIEIYLQLTDVEAQTQGGLTLEGQSLNLNGSIFATISGLIRLNISKASASAPLEVSVDEITIAVESATSQFASADANAVFTLAQSVLRTTIEDLLVDTLNGSFIDQLPALLEDTLGGLDSALKDQSIELDLGFGTPLTLNLDAGISSISTKYRHSLHAPLQATTSIDTLRTQPSTRGVPLMQAPANPFFNSSRIQIGLRLGFLNGLLHTLWDAGILELDVVDQLPIQADEAFVSAKLQPMIIPPLEGQDGTFVVQLGQVELTISFLGKTDVYGLNLELPVDFGIVGDSIQLGLDAEPEIKAWVISTERESPILTPEALIQLFKSQVFPELLAALGDGLSIPLPVPELTGLGGIAPPLGAFSIAFDLYRRIEVRNEWIVLDMTLQGTL